MYTQRDFQRYNWFILHEVRKMKDSWGVVSEIASDASAYPEFSRVGTFLFIKKVYKIYCFLRYNHRNIKINIALDKIKSSEETLERILYIVNGYSIYINVHGKIIFRPMGIFSLCFVDTCK